MNTMTLQQICDELPVLTLNNTPDNPFWFCKPKRGGERFQTRFDQTRAKRGDLFEDANNGDTWNVLAVNAEHRRMIVRNVTQNLIPALVVWNETEAA